MYVESELARLPLFSASLNSVFLILGGLSAVPAGKLCGSLGIQRVYWLGSAGTCMGALIFLSEDALFLVGLSIGFGLATGLLVTAGHAYLMQSAPEERLGSGSAYYFLGMTLGTSLGNLLAGQLVEHGGFALTGWALLSGTVVVLLGIAFFLPEPPGEVVPKDSEALASRGPMLWRSSVQLILAVRFLPTCYWGTATLLVPLLVYRVTESVSWSAGYASASLALAAGAQVLAGKWADRVGPKVPTLTASALVAVSALGTGLFAESLLGLFVFGISGAVSAWSVSTMLPRLMSLAAGPGEKPHLVGWSHLAWSLAMVCGNLWGGFAVELHSGLPFAVVFVGCVVTVYLFSRLFQLLEAAPEPETAPAA